MLESSATKQYLEEGYLQRLTTELTSYGLTTGQARLYLFLLGKSPLPAGQISKEMGVHRVEVYRQLRQMEEVGVIQLFLDSPRRFTAAKPGNALNALVSKMEGRISELRGSCPSLEERLKVHETGQKMRSMTINLEKGIDNYYKFARGREGYFDELKKMIRDANTEVLIITSAKGIVRASLNGFYEVYSAASRRGVSIRMVAEVNRYNLKFANRFSRILELRHIAEVYFRFTVVDRSTALFSAKFDDNNLGSKSDSDSFFCFNDPAMNAAWRFLFYHLWNDATPYDKQTKILAGPYGRTGLKR